MAERDAVKRLHMLCDWVEKQMDESPYGEDAWDNLQDEVFSLRKDLAFFHKKYRTDTAALVLISDIKRMTCTGEITIPESINVRLIELTKNHPFFLGQ